jgi:hypothetical protein
VAVQHTQQQQEQQPHPGPPLLQLQALLQQALLAEARPPRGVPAGELRPLRGQTPRWARIRSQGGGALANALAWPLAPLSSPSGAEAVRYAEAATLALAALAAQGPSRHGARSGAPAWPAPAPLLRLLSPAGAHLETLRPLGRGGFGSVAAVRSRLDGRWAGHLQGQGADSSWQRWGGGGGRRLEAGPPPPPPQAPASSAGKGAP